MTKPPDRLPGPRRIEEAMSALQRSLERLRASRDMSDVEDDADLLGAILDGDPSAGDGLEVLRRVMRYALAMEDYRDMVDRRIDQLKARQARYDKAAGEARAIVFAAMVTLEMRQLPGFPEATVSLRSTPATLNVYDEAAIPAEFWEEVPATRKLDKRALATYLKMADAPSVPGASLTNGSGTLAVRRM